MQDHESMDNEETTKVGHAPSEDWVRPLIPQGDKTDAELQEDFDLWKLSGGKA